MQIEVAVELGSFTLDAAGSGGSQGNKQLRPPHPTLLRLAAETRLPQALMKWAKITADPGLPLPGDIWRLSCCFAPPPKWTVHRQINPARRATENKIQYG